ncbi:hypothetical protein [Croceicoccus sp. BE223]|uniref:hypothetical protein n=1 Tax=Croceicoccus sp. BE223 TaxID=2817716 RepID=UPI002854E42E|nr:hypothetical protein [Croceicoccus sp. BE223]MDR7103176.1 hypothetical protein [Croceicoccus sp. BE223]
MALATAVWVASLLMGGQRMAAKELVLEYKRPWGHVRSVDPGRKYEKVADYVVFIADHCAVKNWKLDGTIGVTDIEDTAWLRIEDGSLSDPAFACLLKFADAPFVTVSRQPVSSRSMLDAN